MLLPVHRGFQRASSKVRDSFNICNLLYCMIYCLVETPRLFKDYVGSSSVQRHYHVPGAFTNPILHLSSAIPNFKGFLMSSCSAKICLYVIKPQYGELTCLHR